MTEFNRENIKKRLQELPPRLAAAFAVRAALRVLPMLAQGRGKKDFLWFWPEKKRERHLLSVFRAPQAACLGLLEKNRDIAAYYADTYDAAAATAAYAAYNAAATADDAAAADAAAAAAAAADAAADAAYDADAAAAYAAAAANYTLKKLSLDELNFLKEDNDIFIYLQTPLWPALPEEFRDLYETFIQQLKNMGAGFDYWAEWHQERIEGKPLDLALLHESVLLPSEIKEQKKPAEINAYLKQLRDAKAAKKLNRVRAIFIGFGAAGKTSLIRALYDEAVVEGKEKMTAGIDIREWPVPGSDIKAHLWDFGGQVMAHATHQFFLRSHCLYVVVLDARTEINANQQAEYWLEHVRAFGRNAPVLLAGNKSDLARVNLDMNRLQEDYPNIVDFYPLSCVRREGKYAPEFQRFLRDLSTQLQQTGTHQVRFSKPHFAVLEELRKRSPREAFLDKSLFKDICAKQGVTAAGALNREWLLDLFDKLGVVIHFPDIPRLEAYVLNPRWLTYGVYTLLYAETSQKRRGRLKGREAVEILQAEEVKDNLGNVLTYRPVERCYFILEAMERFQLCYRLPGEQDIFILPDLLPSDRPKEKTLKFAKQQALSFDFDFEGFLPRHLISSFIVRRHTEIVDNLVWQNGVRLRAKTLEAEALAQADYHARRLSLWVTGRQAGRYFAVLHDEIMQMLERMPDLPYDEFTGLPESARTSEAIRSVARQVVPRADFRDLLAKEAAGERKFTCKYGTYNLTEVLKIMPEEKRREQAPVQIHIEGSSIGAMNWGDISGQVANSIQQLDNSENAGAIKEALSELQKLLERSELPEQDKADALEEVQTLAVAAQDPEDKKQQSAGRKALKYLNGLAAGLPKANKLSGDLLSLGTKLAKLFSWLQVV